MVIFHSYVSLPEGSGYPLLVGGFCIGAFGYWPVPNGCVRPWLPNVLALRFYLRMGFEQLDKEEEGSTVYPLVNEHGYWKRPFIVDMI